MNQKIRHRYDIYIDINYFRIRNEQLNCQHRHVDLSGRDFSHINYKLVLNSLRMVMLVFHDIAWQTKTQIGFSIVFEAKIWFFWLLFGCPNSAHSNVKSICKIWVAKELWNVTEKMKIGRKNPTYRIERIEQSSAKIGLKWWE